MSAINTTLPYRLLSKREVAGMLNCTVRTVERMVAANRITYTKIPTSGKSERVVFDSREIDALIASGRQPAAC